jgi:predicted TIM-barrel fold metal-dependent hydrolase
VSEYPIIDVDIHPGESKLTPLEPHIPRYALEAVKTGMGAQPSNGYVNPFGVTRRDARCSLPDQTAADHLDKHNIAYAVIQPPGMTVSITNQIDVGSALAIAWNDWQIENWLKADERYLGSVCVNMRDPEAAIAEIRRCGPHKQMVQLCIIGESDDLYGHRRYHPIYEAAVEQGLAITIHPGREGCLNSATPVGRVSNYFQWHTLIPLTYQAHLVSLVTEGVFEKFPSLKFILCEGGVAWLAHTMWRMEKNFKSLRASVPWLKRMPSEYIFDNIRLTSQPLEEPFDSDHLPQLFDMINAKRTLCFATDFPHWDFDDPNRAIPKSIDPALRRRIMYDNAAETFGLPTLEETMARMAARKPVAV